MKQGLPVLLLAIMIPGFIQAQKNVSAVNEQDTSYKSYKLMPQIEVIVEKNDRLFKRIPGSVTIIGNKQLNTIVPVSGNDVLKKVPGINVVDEEGAGLRVNIGIRGLDPDRSRSILVLEDGIPVALNPYGEPEMYFTPVIDKMKGVEVLKGSGQILFGPQTIGGVVNFITANPPAKQTTEIKLRAGENGYFSGYASHGNTIGNVGFVISYLHKRADNMGPTWFTINDLSAKIRFAINEKSNVGIKLGVYDELSNSTYVGLTQTMFDKGGQDYVRISPYDRLPVRRYNASITHQYRFSDNIQLQTTAFAYTTNRDWRRQEFSTNPNAANKTGVVWGDPAIPGGTLYMLNTNGHRNRQFEVSGIEPKLVVKHRLFNLSHTLQAGTRLLWEKANEQFIIGNKADAAAGNMRDNEVRKGFSVSGYALNEIQISSKWSANIGFRVENFNYDRRIYRGRFTVNGTPNVVADTNVLANSNTFEIIPGAGLNFTISEHASLFAGVHRGFAPPRTKDAITANGTPLDIEAEISTNYELGARFAIGRAFSGEITGFFMDFSNQVIPVSQSSGNANATGLANGGRTRHTGAELAVETDIAKIFGSRHSFIIGANATLVKSEYAANRFIAKGSDNFNVKGNKLPYAPSFLMTHTIGFELASGFGARFYGNYTSEQFTDELNTELPDATGLIGKIEARYIVDGAAYYHLPGNKFSFNIAVKNIANERFMASRRPQGIKVGMPRFFTAGVDIRL